MIRVTVELLPASGGKLRHLGTATISNDGEGTLDVGNYKAVFSQMGRPDKVCRRGRVRGFRRTEHGCWDLLFLALKDAVGDRHR